MNETLHVRIVKDYAADVIVGLNTLGAVELLASLPSLFNTPPVSDTANKTNESLHYVSHSAEWINTELYLYGEIYQEGGITPNIHIQTKEYGKLTTSATKQQLADAGEILDRICGVKVTGKQGLEDKIPFDLQLDSFIDYNPCFDKSELDLLIAKAAPNLSEIKNVDDWLSQIRGRI
jgi:hypothetical protein